MTATVRGRELRPECKLDAHGLCRPGPVVTPSGDVALTIRCDCPCHKKKESRHAP